MDQTETPQETIKRQAEKLCEIQKKLEGLGDSIDTDLAVEVLEYHNKNLLAGDDKRRSEERMQRLQFCIRKITELKHLAQ